MIKYLLLIWLSFFSSTLLIGHQTEMSSTMLVEQKDGTWILEVRSALAAFEFQIHQLYGEDSYDSVEAFQKLVIDHLIDHIEIEVNKVNALEFANGIVKLGHETNVVFEVKGMPEVIENISIINSSFQDIYHNQSALFVLKRGFKRKQFMLNNINKHKVILESTGYSFERNFEEEKYNFVKDFRIIGVAIFVLVFLVYIVKRVNEKRKLKL